MKWLQHYPPPFPPPRLTLSSVYLPASLLVFLLSVSHTEVLHTFTDEIVKVEPISTKGAMCVKLSFNESE
jgi:hypothetical protein